jgi:DNA-binding NarL/FixJ family response regulator
MAHSSESRGVVAASDPAILDASHRAVLQLIADGESYDEAAFALRLEREAVDHAMSALRRNLGAATDEHAVAIALRAHLID